MEERTAVGRGLRFGGEANTGRRFSSCSRGVSAGIEYLRAGDALRPPASSPQDSSVSHDIESCEIGLVLVESGIERRRMRGESSAMARSCQTVEAKRQRSALRALFRRHIAPRIKVAYLRNRVARERSETIHSSSRMSSRCPASKSVHDGPGERVRRTKCSRRAKSAATSRNGLFPSGDRHLPPSKSRSSESSRRGR